MAEKTKQARLTGALTLMRARYIIETEEWPTLSLSDKDDPQLLVAHAMGAARTGDVATAEKMLSWLAALDKSKPAPASNAHADHGVAGPTPGTGASDGSKSVWIMTTGLEALVSEARGNGDAAIAKLRDAVKVEETMRPPNGAADPIKPSHELLGEVLLRARKPAEAAAAFEAGFLRMPNRPRSLYGAAVAHAAAGRADLAKERWSALQSFWQGKPFAPPTFK